MTHFNFKKWNTILGWFAFLIAFITYHLTVEPTVSFWDAGEYILTSSKLQVGHPPGAPLFQMFGAFFLNVCFRTFSNWIYDEYDECHCLVLLPFYLCFGPLPYYLKKLVVIKMKLSKSTKPLPFLEVL